MSYPRPKPIYGGAPAADDIPAAGAELDLLVQDQVLRGALPPLPGGQAPRYSTDLTLAMAVVSTLRRRSDGHFTLLAFTTEWRAGWLTPGTDDIAGHGFQRFIDGATPAEAICRAAVAYVRLPKFGGPPMTAARRSPELPSPFSTTEVRAILAGTKRMMRRAITPQPIVTEAMLACPERDHLPLPERVNAAWQAGFIDVRCPFGEPGDRLWVREAGWEPKNPTVRELREGADTWPDYVYDADGVSEIEAEQFRSWGWKRRPATHMPRRAARILLDITAVRIERVQDISADDAAAEGIRYEDGSYELTWMTPAARGHQRVADFRKLWDSLNAARGFGWDANPWVWVVSFRRVESPEARATA